MIHNVENMWSRNFRNAEYFWSGVWLGNVDVQSGHLEVSSDLLLKVKTDLFAIAWRLICHFTKMVVNLMTVPHCCHNVHLSTPLAHISLEALSALSQCHPRCSLAPCQNQPVHSLDTVEYWRRCSFRTVLISTCSPSAQSWCCPGNSLNTVYLSSWVLYRHCPNVKPGTPLTLTWYGAGSSLCTFPALTKVLL